MRKPFVLALFSVAVVLLGAAVTVPAPASAAPNTAADVLAELRLEAEHSTGYDRALFRHWIDADRDGCDTRREVLIAESTTTVSVSSGCTIVGGTWTSYYDGVTTTNASEFDIDHLVPLKEAWRSGAHAWSAEVREAFANDLDFAPSLVAVTASSNRSKSDRDPVEWLPAATGTHCRYATEWVLVKYRWQLAIDPNEHTALNGLLSGDCGAAPVDPPPVVGPSPIDGVPPTAPAGSAVYRFWSDTKQGHFYTQSVAERDFVMQNYPTWVWKYEGAAYAAFSTQEPGTVPLYRFWSDLYQGHFYTTDEAEKAYVIATYPRYVWAYERVAYYVYPESSAATETVPVARFWSDTKGHHFYTASPEEAAYVKANYPRAVWAYERDAFRVPSGAPAAAPISNPGNIRNCTDFASYAEAKDWYDKFAPLFGDIARLDGNGDGIPCESML